MASATTCDGYVYLTNENKFKYVTYNNTSINVNSENCYEVKNNLHNILAGNQMNQLADKNMQKFLDNQRKTIQDLEYQYLKPVDVNSSMNLQLVKQKLAVDYWSQAYQQRSAYLEQNHYDTKQILDMMKILKQQRINIDSIPQ